MALDISPFDGPIGAEVSGIDLARPVAAADQKVLEDAWNAHAVLVFRGQTLEPADLVRFSRGFGALEIHVLDQYLHADHPEILVVSNIQENGEPIGIYDAGRYWHSDLSYLAEPSRGSVLYAIEIPEEGGETLGNTLWAHAGAAYEALDDGLKARLDGLEAAFDLGKRFQKLVDDGDADAAMTDEQIKKTPEVVHPVIRTHPVTGRKSIFVNIGHTTHILGLPADESQAILEELWAHCIRPEFVYRHKWREGDVVMWDNVPTQHLAICDYALPQRRLLHLTTLSGDRPY